MPIKDLKTLSELEITNRRLVERLNPQQIDNYLAILQNWQLKQQLIQRDLQCSTFTETSRWVNEVINLANALNHHPEVHFGYKDMTICLTTHSCAGPSILDFIFAASLEIKMIE